MEIFALREGSYSVDASKKFIPFDPQIHNFRERPGSLFIHINPFLVKTSDDLILFDAGLGYKDTRDELFLHQHIRSVGFDPEDVSLVLMSHLHYDHSGGLVVEHNGRLEPSFPDAKHVIQRGEWEDAINGRTSSYHKEIFEALNGKVEIEFVERSGTFKPGIRYELSGGHCPHHQVFWLDDNGEKCFFGGDELPEPEQLIRKFIAKYDYDGRRSMELREEYGKIVAKEGDTCLFYHAKSMPVGKVRYENETFVIEKV
jgi:glyoxylase-like metal-dependent hydrolase (beta-lactamase superfamily II)